jgi:hypothetical protein
MEKLRSRFLKRPVTATLTPTPSSDKKVVNQILQQSLLPAGNLFSGDKNPWQGLWEETFLTRKPFTYKSLQPLLNCARRRIGSKENFEEPGRSASFTRLETEETSPGSQASGPTVLENG